MKSIAAMHQKEHCFAKKFDRTIRGLLNKPVFVKVTSNFWGKRNKSKRKI